MLILFAISVFSAFCGAVSHEDFESLSKNDLLEDAVNEVISENFKSSAVTINFIISLSDETKRERNILINNIVSRCSSSVVIQNVEFIAQRHRLHNVIFIDEYESFLLLSERMSSNNFVIDGYFLVIFLKGSIAELSEITRQLWSISINKICFLVEEDNGVSLLTFLPFSQTQCDDSRPVVVKRFNGSSKENKNLFPEKLSNMFQCSVKVVTFNSPPMMMIKYEDNERKSFDLKGIDGEMLKLLSEIFNFKIHLIHISDLIR